MNNFSRFQMNAYLWRNYVTRRNKYRWRCKRAYGPAPAPRYFRDLFPLILESRLYQGGGGDRSVLCKVTRSA